jgi:hypothetical protein
MRVKDSDRLRGLLQKIERSRALKMQDFPEMGVKPTEINSLAVGENIPTNILNQRKLNQRFIHRGGSISRRVSPPAAAATKNAQPEQGVSEDEDGRPKQFKDDLTNQELQVIRKSLGDKLVARITDTAHKSLLIRSQVDLSRPRYADKQFVNLHNDTTLSSAFSSNIRASAS